MEDNSSKKAVETKEKRQRKTYTQKNYPGKNLKFLLEFFKHTGLTPESIGRAGGASPQSLREQLRNDNMKISKAETILDALGYTFTIIFTPIENRTIILDEDANYSISLPELDKPIKGQFDKYNIRRLKFFTDILESYQLSARAIARKLDISIGALEAWLRTDDMLISHVNLLKDKMGMKVTYKIDKKQS